MEDSDTFDQPMPPLDDRQPPSALAPEEAARLQTLGAQLMEYHGQLLHLAKRNLHPMLLRRVSPEDVVQDTLAAACRKLDFLENQPEIPVYFKLRMLLFQTLTDLERRHLQSQKRDAFREAEMTSSSTTGTVRLNWNALADSATGPLTHVVREERYEILHKALEGLAENDRQILELRHFDEMSNADCAAVLHISPKNASIRYVRALERLRHILTTLTDFRA